MRYLTIQPGLVELIQLNARKKMYNTKKYLLLCYVLSAAFFEVEFGGMGIF